MKIAMLTPGYPPMVGGIESVVENLARGLVRHGHGVEVWVHDRGAASVTSQRLDGVVVRRFPATRANRFPVSPALWRHARRHATEMDVLHAHSYHAAAAMAVLRCSPTTPVVFSPHYHGGGHTRLASAIHLPYRLVGRRIFARADSIVAVSESERGLIEQDFDREVSPERTAVIHNAVETTEIEQSASRTGEKPTILSLGRLERYKRVDLVINAFGRMTRPGQLVILGDGPDRPRLNELVQSSPRRDDIHLLGFIERADAVAWLRTARVAISLSEHEAFGIIALESIAAGATAILSDIPAHREVAALVPAERTTLVAGFEGLPGLLGQALERPNSGFTPVRDWQSTVDEYLDLYRSVLDRRRVAEVRA